MLSRGRSKQDFSCRGVTSVECPWRMCALGVVGWWPGDGPSVSVVRAVTQPGGNFAACALCARSRSDCEPRLGPVRGDIVDKAVRPRTGRSLYEGCRQREGERETTEAYRSMSGLGGDGESRQ